MVKLTRRLASCRGMLVSALGLAMIASTVVISPGNAAAGHKKTNFAIAFHGDDYDYIGTGILTEASGGGVTGTLNFFGNPPICTDSVSGTSTLNANGVTGTIALTLTFVSSANGDTASDCGDGDTLTFAFARDQGGDTLELAEIDQYVTGTFAEKFEPVVGVAREQSGGKLKGTYGYQFTAKGDYDTGVGAVTVTSGGAVSGSMSLSAGGCICQNTVAGTATTKSDGVTGTMDSR